MKYLVLIFFIYSIYPAHQQVVDVKSRKFLHINIDKSQYSSRNYSFYKSFLTGNKKNFPKPLLSIFKKYGFIHLLTPSGIHLSSLLIFFKFIPFLELIFLTGLFIFFSNFGQYPSIERVIIFRLIYKLVKKVRNSEHNIEITFLITIIVSIFIGHFSSNSMSFIYSFLFWGTIIIFRHSKLKLMFFLNFSLFFISSINSQYHSPISILINPFITFVLSSLFPIFFINSILPSIQILNQGINLIIETCLQFIIIINQYDPFPVIQFSTLNLLISLICVLSSRIKLFVLVLTLSINSTHYDPLVSSSEKVINLGDKSEFLFKKKEWVHFIDQKCRVRDLVIFCKKKPSKWGGPIF